MNVVISNKKQLLLDNLSIDVIKEMHGEYTVEEIVNTFQNFFYQRMILDLTAIKGYENIATIQSLASSLNMSKVILVLDGSPVTNNKTYISKLISLGIYNFTDNIKGVEYLYNNPNSYDDVAKYHINEDSFVSPTSDNIFDSNNKLNNENNVNSTDTDNKESNTDSEKKSFWNEYHFFDKESSEKCKVLGIKNLTKESGATSLTYMIVKTLSKKYKVIGIEINKNDFVYFKDNNLISTTNDNFESTLKKYESYDAIIVDLNDNMSCESLCNDVIYLIEPSIIKIQKLITLNKNSLQGYKNKKVILNQSLLNSSAVSAFEYESGLRIFYNLAPLNEREDRFIELEKMLDKMGFKKLR